MIPWPTLLLSCAKIDLPAGFEQQMAFEDGEDQAPAGWVIHPAGGAVLDADQVHGGQQAIRIDRGTQSEGELTTVSRTLPVDFRGHTLSLRGFLRTESVSSFAGLWLRLDGHDGVIALDNMFDQGLTGTRDWSSYEVRLSITEAARTAVFGVMLVGDGTVWADDLQLWVDDHPIESARPRPPSQPSILETDTEFDSGSGIVLEAPSQVQIDNLVLLCEVWGFLKYHHPKLTSGQLHLDYELFRILPAILDSADAAEGREVIAGWVQQIGLPDPCRPCAELPDDLHLSADLSWISDRARLGGPLADALQQIHQDRHAKGPQAYVSLEPGVGNPSFAGELSYKRLRAPDPGYRLLALFRLWNIVRYWFPYRDQIDGDWDEVLPEFIPRLAAAPDADAYKLTLLELIGRIGDTHANLWGSLDVQPPRGEATLPARLRFIEDQLVVAELDPGAPPDGLARGDVLLSLDAEPIEALVQRFERYYPASNEPTRRRDLAKALADGPTGPTSVGILRDGVEQTLQLQRVPRTSLSLSPWHDRPGEALQHLSPEIAYLKPSAARDGAIDDYLQAAADSRGLIVDLRGYPSSFLVFDLGQRLVEASTPFVRFTTGQLGNPGAFRWGPPLSLEPRGPRHDGQIVILIDEITQSQAEYTAMALRAAPGAIVVGSTTAGADGNVSRIPLPGGLSAMISGIGVFYPDQTPTQRIGIVPDVVQTPTLAGIRAGRDEVLEEGLRQILGDEVAPEQLIELARPSGPEPAAPHPAEPE